MNRADKIAEIRRLAAGGPATLEGWTGPKGSLEAMLGEQVAGAVVSGSSAAASQAKAEAEACRKAGDLDGMDQFTALVAEIRRDEALSHGRCTECGHKSDSLKVIGMAVCCPDCAETF